MKMYWLLFLAFGLAKCDKLDRTYLPPPGSQLAGGSPGAIDVPLEFPKFRYSTTIRPQDSMQEDVFFTYTESNQPFLIGKDELRNQNTSGNERVNYGEPSPVTRITESPSSLSTQSAETFPRTSESFDYPVDSTRHYYETQFPTRNQQQIKVYPNEDSNKYQIERKFPAINYQQPGSKVIKVTQPTESQVVIAYDENGQPIYNQPILSQDMKQLQDSFVTPSIFPAIRRPSLASASNPKDYNYATQRYPLTELTKNNILSATSPFNVTQENNAYQSYFSPDNSKSEDVHKQNNLMTTKITATTKDYNTDLKTAVFDKYLSTSPSSVLSASLEEVTSSPILNGLVKSNSASPLDLFNPTQRPQAESDRNAVILKNENFITPEGDFAYNYDTSNGIHADESGSAADGVKAIGSYSYTGDDGNVYTVTYTADENGFRPQGSHLPTPPPIPEAILRVLEKNAKDKVTGIEDDGSYDDTKYGYKKYQGAMDRYYPHENEKALAKDNDDFKIGATTFTKNEDLKMKYGQGKPNPTQFNDGSGDYKDYDLIESEEVEISTEEPDIFSHLSTKIPMVNYQPQDHLPSNLKINDKPANIDNINKRRRPLPIISNNMNVYENKKDKQDGFSPKSENEFNKLISTQKNINPGLITSPLHGIKSLSNQDSLDNSDDINDDHFKQSSPYSKISTVYKDFSIEKPNSIESSVDKNRQIATNDYTEPERKGQVFPKEYKNLIPKLKVDGSKYKYIPPLQNNSQTNTVTQTFEQNNLSTLKPITDMSNLQNKEDNIYTSTINENIDESGVFDNEHPITSTNKSVYTTSLPIAVTKYSRPPKYDTTEDGKIIPVKVFGQDISGGKPFYNGQSRQSTSTTVRPLIQGNALEQSINRSQTIKPVTKPYQRIVTSSRQPVYNIFSSSTSPSILTDVTARPVSYTHSYPGEAVTSTTYSPSMTSRPTIVYPDDTIITDYEDTLLPEFTGPKTKTTNFLSGIPTTSFRPGSIFEDKFANIRPITIDKYGRPITKQSQPDNIVIQKDSETHPGYTYPSPNESRTVSEGNPSYGPVKGQSLTKISTAKPNYGTKITKVYGEDFSGPKQAQSYDKETGYYYK